MADKELTTKYFFENADNELLPAVALNDVIFGFDDNKVKVLLLNYGISEKWTLPGGFVFKDEELLHSAERLLKSVTGLESVFLKQFGVFGGVNRSQEEMRAIFKNFEGIDIPKNHYLFQRFVVLGYLALIKYHQINPGLEMVNNCDWFDVENLPVLTFDHNLIVETALRELRFQLNYLPVGYNLLPEEFPLKSLQTIYETILGKKLDRGNFNRKILSFGILEKREKFYSGAAHKAPFLYSFNKEKYFNALENGMGNF